MAFNGFTEKSIVFLKDLAANNNKEWFENNRPVYEKHIMEPMRQLATDLGPFIRSVDPEIETSPVVNKTISKIYRDVRFSADKSPFRTGLWISYRRPNKVWGNVPEFYLYFTPEEYQYGMGFYSATPANMQKIRDHIELHAARFEEIAEIYDTRDDLVVMGGDYKKRIPNSLPEKLQPWYQKRNLYVNSTRKIDSTFYSAGLKDDIENYFRDNAGLYLFIIEAIL